MLTNERAELRVRQIEQDILRALAAGDLDRASGLMQRTSRAEAHRLASLFAAHTVALTARLRPDDPDGALLALAESLDPQGETRLLGELEGVVNRAGLSIIDRGCD